MVWGGKFLEVNYAPYDDVALQQTRACYDHLSTDGYVEWVSELQLSLVLFLLHHILYIWNLIDGADVKHIHYQMHKGLGFLSSVLFNYI